MAAIVPYDKCPVYIAHKSQNEDGDWEVEKVPVYTQADVDSKIADLKAYVEANFEPKATP